MMRPRTHGGAPKMLRLTQLWPKLKMYTVRLAENTIPAKERKNKASVLMLRVENRREIPGMAISKYTTRP
jgi:hypothetical protein